MKSRHWVVLLVLIISNILIPSAACPVSAAAYNTTEDFSFVILNSYEETASIGDEFYLFAFTSTGKKPSFKSSDSKIASVNTYGLVTAKRNGTAKITAKIKDAEAWCTVTVKKTELTINTKNASLECGESIRLCCTTSNGSTPKFKSNRRSIAEVDESGKITAKKPGDAIITITADTTVSTCKIHVKSPTLRLSQTKATLYRTNTLKLDCTVSSGKRPVWKSNRKSVATVDESGNVTAVKHGTALISAKVDGVTKTCEVTVKQPSISLNNVDVVLTEGEQITLTAAVSSGNLPVWSVSNSSILSIDHGTITALSKGTAYVYACEDGIRARCKVKVVSPKK